MNRFRIAVAFERLRQRSFLNGYYDNAIMKDGVFETTPSGHFAQYDNEYMRGFIFYARKHKIS